MSVIKRVGNADIILRESNSCSRSPWLVYLSMMIFFSMWLIIECLRIKTTGIDILSDVEGIIYSGVCASLITMLAAFGLVVSSFGETHTLTYEVLATTGCYDSIKTIPKTAPEADQIAICKAAKEIEAELIEIQTREARLEEMARKCK